MNSLIFKSKLLTCNLINYCRPTQNWSQHQYSGYIEHIQQQLGGDSIEFWTKEKFKHIIGRLSGATPCVALPKAVSLEEEICTGAHKPIPNPCFLQIGRNVLWNSSWQPNGYGLEETARMLGGKEILVETRQVFNLVEHHNPLRSRCIAPATATLSGRVRVWWTSKGGTRCVAQRRITVGQFSMNLSSSACWAAAPLSGAVSRPVQMAR